MRIKIRVELEPEHGPGPGDVEGAVGKQTTIDHDGKKYPATIISVAYLEGTSLYEFELEFDPDDELKSTIVGDQIAGTEILEK